MAIRAHDEKRVITPNGHGETGVQPIPRPIKAGNFQLHLRDAALERTNEQRIAGNRRTVRRELNHARTGPCDFEVQLPGVRPDVFHPRSMGRVRDEKPAAKQQANERGRKRGQG